MRTAHVGWPCCAARWLRVAAVLLLYVVPGAAAAVTDVLVVNAERSPGHEEAVASMRAALAGVPEKELRLHVVSVAEFSRTGARAKDWHLPDLIVTLGTDAAAAVLRERLPTPSFCTLLPQAAYATLASELADTARPPRAPVSVLYLDQPLTRQLRLIQLALPTHKRIGVVLGPESRKNERSLRRDAMSAGFMLHAEQISDERQLVGALHRAMADADVLLAVPDPLVFNRHTAQNVLLTTYRLGKPVSGYSRAYVTAGALLAVYSTPAQIGRQIGEDLLAMHKKSSRPLPAPGYPRYFSVEINERVARSLGLTPGQTEDLTHRLTETNEAIHE